MAVKECVVGSVLPPTTYSESYCRLCRYFSCVRQGSTPLRASNSGVLSGRLQCRAAQGMVSVESRLTIWTVRLRQSTCVMLPPQMTLNLAARSCWSRTRCARGQNWQKVWPSRTTMNLMRRCCSGEKRSQMQRKGQFCQQLLRPFPMQNTTLPLLSCSISSHRGSLPAYTSEYGVSKASWNGLPCSTVAHYRLPSPQTNSWQTIFLPSSRNAFFWAGFNRRIRCLMTYALLGLAVTVRVVGARGKSEGSSISVWRWATASLQREVLAERRSAAMAARLPTKRTSTSCTSVMVDCDNIKKFYNSIGTPRETLSIPTSLL